MQTEVIDSVEALAPVVKFQWMRCLITISAYYGLKLEQMNVVTAFLNADVEEEIYISVPQGRQAQGSGSILASQSWSRCLDTIEVSFPEIPAKSSTKNQEAAPPQWHST